MLVCIFEINEIKMNSNIFNYLYVDKDTKMKNICLKIHWNEIKYKMQKIQK